MPAERHLYIAIWLNSTTSQVERYPMVNGLPAAQPDLIYPGITTPMAIGADGTFYATLQPLGSYGESAIQVFPFGSTQSTRSIVLPSLSDITYANALAVMPNGELYVGYGSSISGDAFVPSIAKKNIPGHGIAVYLPQASGTLPFTAYSFADVFGSPAGLTFGPQGRLYAVGYRESRFGPQLNYVTELAEPWSGPHIVDRLHVANGQATYATSVAFTDTSEMYVLVSAATQTVVQVYPLGAHGAQKPSRTITLANYLGPVLAFDGTHMFTTVYPWTRQTQELIAYPKDARGSPHPSFVRTFSNGEQTAGVVIGP